VASDKGKSCGAIPLTQFAPEGLCHGGGLVVSVVGKTVIVGGTTYHQIDGERPGPEDDKSSFCWGNENTQREWSRTGGFNM
jgi:hypothetical protein